MKKRKTLLTTNLISSSSRNQLLYKIKREKTDLWKKHFWDDHPTTLSLLITDHFLEDYLLYSLIIHHSWKSKDHIAKTGYRNSHKKIWNHIQPWRLELTTQHTLIIVLSMHLNLQDSDSAMVHHGTAYGQGSFDQANWNTWIPFKK